MSLLTSINLDISTKLENKEYRKRFFRRQTENEIAKSIIFLRKMRRKRQSDLADETQMKQSAISRIEQAEYGGWSFQTLFRVADALDARLRVIFEPTETVIESYKQLENEQPDRPEFVILSDTDAMPHELTEEELRTETSTRSVQGGAAFADATSII